MSSHFVITGATGGAPNRLEINDFVKNERFFSLYIQALQTMYTSGSQDDVQSFFQIAGIHGLPYEQWDGTTGAKPFDPRQQWGGYCIHGSVLFPTWHRPYIMLFEQILCKHAQDVAATYTLDQALWKKAADDMRQPYWDWARNSVPPPEVISLAQVTIVTPNGRRTAVDNPLRRYRFHPIDPSFPSPYSRWPTTVRQSNTTGSNAADNVTRLQSVLRSAQSDIRSKTYSMLTRVRTWTAFSNHTVGDGGSSSNSLEAIHDGIHVYVGGNGQMSDPSVAAFDPIFFLHHCNVDRLLSLWKGMNPNAWVTRGDAEDGSFTIVAETPVDQETDLSPFRKNQTTFWKSDGVEDTVKLGYSYPEFNGLDMGNPAAVQAAITQIVQALYGGGARRPSALFTSMAAMSPSNIRTGTVTKGDPAAPIPQTMATASTLKSSTEESLRVGEAQVALMAERPEENPGEDSQVWDWTARIEFKKYELGCSFSVLVFLGNVPEDTDEWLISPNFVGAHHAFVNRSAERCANCRNQVDLIDEGFVHLNDGIIEHSGLQSLQPELVEPYLKENMHWRVLKTDGTAANLESLEVSVICTPMTLLPGADLPSTGEPQRRNWVTHGRPGGCRQA